MPKSCDICKNQQRECTYCLKYRLALLIQKHRTHTVPLPEELVRIVQQYMVAIR